MTFPSTCSDRYRERVCQPRCGAGAADLFDQSRQPTLEDVPSADGLENRSSTPNEIVARRGAVARLFGSARARRLHRWLSCSEPMKSASVCRHAPRSAAFAHAPAVRTRLRRMLRGALLAPNVAREHRYSPGSYSRAALFPSASRLTRARSVLSACCCWRVGIAPMWAGRARLALGAPAPGGDDTRPWGSARGGVPMQRRQRNMRV